MQISLVSSSIKSLPCFEPLLDFSDITVHESTMLEDLFKTHITLDFIFFDAELGAENIIQQINLYSEKNPQIKWLVINPSDIQQSLQYIQAGASGILANPNNKKKLQNCFQSMSRDQLYLEKDLIQILALRQIKKILQPFSQLTAREYDVFCLLAENYSIQTTASLLSISAKTAFNCQTKIRKKLTLKNQLEITQFAKKHGLII